MPVLQQRDQEIVRQRFNDELQNEVKLTLYTQNSLGGRYIPGRECQTCEPTRQILEEVSELSPKISLDVVDFYGNQEAANARGVDMIPAIIIGDSKYDNLKYFGMPSGSEFAVLLDTLVASSRGESNLQDETRARLKLLKQDVHIKVFVTPT